MKCDKGRPTFSGQEELNGMKEVTRIVSKYVNDESLTEEEKAYLDKYINV